MCVCVCLTLYRLSPWTWYKLKNGIIRTIRTWTRDFWKKFSRKVTSGQITGENVYDFNAFLWWKFSAFCFHFWKSIFSQNIKQFTTNINFKRLLKIDLLNLYNKKQICVSVCPFMHSNCGHFRAKPITYSESAWPGGAALTIHFPEKWPVAKLPKKRLRC